MSAEHQWAKLEAGFDVWIAALPHTEHFPGREGLAKEERVIAGLLALIHLFLLLLPCYLYRAENILSLTRCLSVVLLTALGDNSMQSTGMDGAAGSGFSLKPQNFAASV